MVENLTLGDILKCINELKASGIKDSEIEKIPVYLGDDEELNGIHTAFYMNTISSESENFEDEYITGMINERGANIPFTGVAVLIS